MPQDQPLVSRVSGDVLTGYYKRKRLNQEEVAERSGIPLVSLQKKLRGKAPITATDFVVIARAIGVEPAEVMAEVMKDVARIEQETSEGVVNLTEHRRRKTPAEMTEEEMEGERSAANTDPDADRDEPDIP